MSAHARSLRECIAIQSTWRCCADARTFPGRMCAVCSLVRMVALIVYEVVVVVVGAWFAQCIRTDFLATWIVAEKSATQFETCTFYIQLIGIAESSSLFSSVTSSIRCLTFPKLYPHYQSPTELSVDSYWWCPPWCPTTCCNFFHMHLKRRIRLI